MRVGDLDVVGLETVPQGQQHLAADSAGSGVALTPASYPELDWEDAAKIAAAAAALPPAYLEVVNKQAAEIPDLISQVEAGNAREAERAAHSLKSYSASFGARSLWSLAQEAEARAKAGDLAAVSGMMEAMHAAHGQARHSASAGGYRVQAGRYITGLPDLPHSVISCARRLNNQFFTPSTSSSDRIWPRLGMPRPPYAPSRTMFWMMS